MLRQTLLYMPAQLLGPLAMFVAAVVWTHVLNAETYGAVFVLSGPDWRAALAIVAFAALLGWLGAVISVRRHLAGA